MTTTVDAPAQKIQTFGGLVKVPLNQVSTLLVVNGITFKGSCTPSTTDASQFRAAVTVASDEAGTWYSSLSLFSGNYVEIGPTDGDVEVYSYDAGCDQPGGPFYVGGIAFSIAKPGGTAINGVMSCGVGLLGGDAVFSGMLLL